MATVYSGWSANWKPSGSSVNKKFRTWLTYSTSSTATAVTITASMGIELNSAVTATFTENYISTQLGSASAVTQKSAGSKSTSFNSGTLTWTWISSQTIITVQKTTAAQTIKVRGYSMSSSASWNEHCTAIATITIPALTSYTISYNANGGSGTIANQTKWYNKNLTLAKSGFTLADYTLTGWKASNGTVYNLGATYSANAATTLTAQWKLNYTKPTITNLQAFRVSSSSDTTESPTGQYIRLRFNFTPGKVGSNAVSTTEYTVSVNGSELYGYPKTPSNSSIDVILNGTSSATAATYTNNTSHTITIKLYDGTDSVGITKTITVGSATFPIDIMGKGGAMGLMTPAIDGQAITMQEPHIILAGTNIVRLLRDAIYPVGSYYETSKSPTEFDPNTYFGGTWVQEVQGQVHVSAGSSYPVSTTNATSGGSTTHKLTVTELPAHHHQQYGPYSTGTGSSAGYVQSSNRATTRVNTDDTGGNTAFSIMQPYRNVYRWWRTA